MRGVHCIESDTNDVRIVVSCHFASKIVFKAHFIVLKTLG